MHGSATRSTFWQAQLIIATFTPLRGLTPFVDHYLETATMADAAGNVVNAKVGMFGEPHA